MSSNVIRALLNKWGDIFNFCKTISRVLVLSEEIKVIFYIITGFCGAVVPPEAATPVPIAPFAAPPDFWAGGAGAGFSNYSSMNFISKITFSSLIYSQIVPLTLLKGIVFHMKGFKGTFGFFFCLTPGYW